MSAADVHQVDSAATAFGDSVDHASAALLDGRIGHYIDVVSIDKDDGVSLSAQQRGDGQADPGRGPTWFVGPSGIHDQTWRTWALGAGSGPSARGPPTSDGSRT